MNFASLFGNIDPKSTPIVTPKPKPKKTKKASSKKSEVFPNGRIDNLLKSLTDKKEEKKDTPPPDKPKPVINTVATNETKVVIKQQDVKVEEKKKEEIVKKDETTDSIDLLFKTLKASKKEYSDKFQEIKQTLNKESEEGSSLLIYQRYEPKSWEEFVGNNQVISDIRTWFDEVHKNPRYWPRALVIEGPEGVGKSLIPTLLAKEYNYEKIYISYASFILDEPKKKKSKETKIESIDGSNTGKKADDNKLKQIFLQIRSNSNNKLLVLDDADQIFDSPANSLSYLFDSRKATANITGGIAGWWGDIQNELPSAPPPMILIFTNVYKTKITWLQNMQKEYKESLRSNKRAPKTLTSNLTKKVLKANFATLEKVKEYEIIKNLNRIGKASQLYYSQNDPECSMIAKDCFGDVRKSVILLQEANWNFDSSIENIRKAKRKPLQTTSSELVIGSGKNEKRITLTKNNSSFTEQEESTNKTISDLKKVNSVFSFWPLLVNLQPIVLTDNNHRLSHSHVPRMNDIIDEWGAQDPLLSDFIEGKYLYYFSNFEQMRTPITPNMRELYRQTHLDTTYMSPKPINFDYSKLKDLKIKRKYKNDLESHLKALPIVEKQLYSLATIFQYFEGVSFADSIDSQLNRARWESDTVQTKITFEKTKPLLLLKNTFPNELSRIDWKLEIEPFRKNKGFQETSVKSSMIHPIYLGFDETSIIEHSEALLLKIWFDWNNSTVLNLEETKSSINYNVKSILRCRKSFLDCKPTKARGKDYFETLEGIKENYLKAKKAVKPQNEELENYRDDYCWSLLTFGFGFICISSLISSTNKKSSLKDIAEKLKKGTDQSPSISFRLEMFEKVLKVFGVYLFPKVSFTQQLTEVSARIESNILSKISTPQKKRKTNQGISLLLSLESDPINLEES